MNLDRLLHFGDVIPPAIRFPPVRYDLNQRSPHRRIRHVGRTVAIRLHVQLNRLVRLYLSLFDVLDIYAGVLDRRGFLAARNLNRDARSLVQRRLVRRWRLILCANHQRRRKRQADSNHRR